MLARNADIALSKEDAQAVLAGLRTLQAHPDVAPALQRLKAAGFRLATLTNSPQAGVQAQTRHAGIDGFFKRQLTVEGVGRLKPDRTVYEWAAREMGVAPADCMRVAAHGWDVAGAQWAGLRSAFIAREGQEKFRWPSHRSSTCPSWQHWRTSWGLESGAIAGPYLISAHPPASRG